MRASSPRQQPISILPRAEVRKTARLRVTCRCRASCFHHCHNRLHFVSTPFVSPHKMKQLARADSESAQAQGIDERFKLLDRWTFLMMQIFESKKFLDLAENTHAIHPQSSLDEVLTQQALYRSFLLAYGKCFTTSGKGRNSLDPHRVFVGDARAYSVHQRIMDLRHRFAAHSDSSGLDHAVIEVEELDDEFVIAQKYAVANPLHEYADYKEAVRVLEEYVVDQINRAVSSLEKQLQKKVSIKSAG